MKRVKLEDFLLLCVAFAFLMVVAMGIAAITIAVAKTL